MPIHCNLSSILRLEHVGKNNAKNTHLTDISQNLPLVYRHSYRRNQYTNTRYKSCFMLQR